MTGGTSEIDETTFCEEEDFVPAREDDVIDLRFDIFPLVFSHARDIDLTVEMSDIADDGFVTHFDHVIMGDDIFIPGGGDEYISLVAGIIHRDDTVSFHAGLEGTDRVDFCDPDSGSHSTECGSTSFPDISVSADDGDFPGDHDVGGSFDAVDDGFSTSVEVIEFGLGDGVIDIDSREGESSGFEHLVETVNSCSGFLSYSADVFSDI